MNLRVGVVLGLAACAALMVSGCGGSSSLSVGSQVIGPAGGRVEATGVVVDVPPGALTEVVLITVLPLNLTTLPTPPPSGMTLMAAARFEPAGLTFAAPVSITFNLASSLPPNQTMLLYVLQSGVWEDSGFEAVVSSDGTKATAEVSGFSIYALFADLGS